MTGLWSIIVPEQTVNLVTNPSCEVDTTGYTAVGGSVARSTAQARRGLASLAVTATAGTADGVYFGTVPLVTATYYTFSVDVLGVLGVPYRIYFGDTSANVKGTPVAFVGTGAWQRVVVTWLCDSSANYRLYIVKNNSASVAVFYVDGLQCEAKAHDTSYCDGSLKPDIGFVSSGCTWNGVAHASTSTRSANSRAGGWLLNFDSYYFYITSHTGTGAPPVANYISLYADPKEPGGIHEHTKELTRLMILNGIIMGTSLSSLHTRRSNLAYIMRPNWTPEGDPMWIRYAGGANPVEIACHYDGGLEGGVADGFSERVGIRLLAAYPYWRLALV